MKKKSIFATLIAVAMVAGSVGTPVAHATGVDNNAPNDGDGNIYVEASGPSDDERIDGVRQAGTWRQYSNGKWRYIHTDGSYTINDWERIDGNWYFFDGSGYRWTGWKQYNNNWYYFNSNGIMVTGWKKITVGTMQHWYYFKANGKMATTEWLYYNSRWYYFNADGEMVTGWNTINEYTYFFNNDGEFVDSTRKALIIGDGVASSDLDMEGWGFCLGEQLYGGDHFATITSVVGPSSTQLFNYINTLKVGNTESDITYLCFTCTGMVGDNIQIGENKTVSATALKNKLDELAGKVVIFFSLDYSGQIINRGESDHPEQEVLSAFMDRTRSGEFIDEKYVVICSCKKTEVDQNYDFPELNKKYSFANRWWMYGGGWDMLSGANLKALYADYNSNAKVTLDELLTFSASHIISLNPNQPQTVVAYSVDPNFTIFARTSTK